jgi:peptidoglycan hydrolase CwlO-like protein
MSDTKKEAIARAIQGIVECLERLHKQNGEQHKFNTEVLKNFNRMEQEIHMMKVTIGELVKEVKACRT